MLRGDGGLLLLPGLPLVVGGLLLLAGRRARTAAGPLSVTVTLGVLGLTVLALEQRPWLEVDWLPGLPLILSTRGPAGVLGCTVAVMALAVILYGVGYLGRDGDRARFFGFLTLFLGAMEWLVLADDLLALLIGWELVGLCSWALIGFRHHRPDHAQAALRAFVTTRATDLGLYLAILIAFARGGALDFAGLGRLPFPLANLGAAGVILAAAGKSAQFPFCGWLSGAMKGPTPVSALLHSSTLVAAGTVLLIKAQPLLAGLPWSGPVLVGLALVTVLTAAWIGLFQDELKQVTATSTISQHAYMFAALGSGAMAAGTLHLINHAAFKGLMFLCSGVLVRQGLTTFRQMGGLRHRLPLTSLLFALGLLSLAGLPPLGGFFSKETILKPLHQQWPVGYWLLVVLGFLAAACPARAWFAAFAGPPSMMHRPLAGPRATMTISMVLLGALVVLLALPALPPLSQGWADLLGADRPPAIAWNYAWLSLVVSLAAIGWIARRHRRGQLVPMAPLGPAWATRAARHWLGMLAGLDGIGRLVLAAGHRLARLEQWLGVWLPLLGVGLWLLGGLILTGISP